ncbi:MAG TPA: cytochrome c3 family protein [Terriglobales bacterium]|nr:cytochrome c3 family protein [Terriglobales bacterium]
MRRTDQLAIFALLLSVFCLPGGAPPARAQQADTCLDCHAEFPEPIGVAREKFDVDIHAQKGLTCASCHGGDPSKTTPEEAMSPAAGFRGHVDRKQVPELCARCHSDGAYMRQYNPSLRTDQLSQYRTSVHGKLLAKGDDKVAVCTDCHSVHGIRPGSDPRSSIHPLNIAETCSRCHADAAYMQAYKIPTDQYASYKESVHHRALVERGDLSAPTCTTCHGNHGAAPPGVASVEFVCSNCHVFQAQLFDSSPHKSAFAAAGVPACITCHSNHRVVAPGDAMLGAGPQSACTQCHVEGDGGYTAAVTFQRRLGDLQNAILRSDEVLERAERFGMEVSEARLEQGQARDALTKARVTIHSFQLARVEEDLSAGLKIAEKTHQDGLRALQEHDFRRKGLGVSLLAILVVLVALRLYIRQIESGPGKGSA